MITEATIKDLGTINSVATGDWVKVPPYKPFSLTAEVTGTVNLVFEGTDHLQASDTSLVTGGGGGVAVGDPVLLFTDLTYAPKVAQNAFITIWGLNILTTPTPTVRVNGKAQTILSSADDTNLPFHNGLVKAGLVTDTTGFYSKIEVELTNVIAGDTVVTIDGVTGSLPFTVGSTGNIYFLNASTGDDTTGTGLISAPWKTSDKFFQLGAACAGSICYFRASAALYDTSPSSWAIIDWGNRANSGGTAAAPVAVCAYPGELPEIDCSLKRGCVVRNTRNYTTIAKLKFGGASAANIAVSKQTAATDISTGMRVVGIVVTGRLVTSGGNIVGLGRQDNAIVYGCYGHDNGGASNQAQGIYHQGNGISNGLTIEHNRVVNQTGGSGIQLYGHEAGERLFNVSVQYNLIDTVGIGGVRSGIQLSYSDGVGPDHRWLEDCTCKYNESKGSTMHGIYTKSPDCVFDIQHNVCHTNAHAVDIQMYDDDAWTPTTEGAAPGSICSNNCMEAALVMEPLTAANVTATGNEVDYPTCVAAAGGGGVGAAVSAVLTYNLASFSGAGVHNYKEPVGCAYVRMRNDSGSSGNSHGEVGYAK